MTLFKLFSVTSDNPSPIALAIWRNWIAAGMVGLWLFFWWAIGAAGSVVPIMGQGFARSEDVVELKVNDLQRDILQNRIRHCNAETANGRAFIWELLQELLAEYERVTGQQYKLPTCDDLRGL